MEMKRPERADEIERIIDELQEELGAGRDRCIAEAFLALLIEVARAAQALEEIARLLKERR
jgi:hypothetical protein